MDDMFNVNDFSTMRYDTGVCLKKVRKGKFRYKIAFEDLDDNLQGEARELPVEKEDGLDRLRIYGVMQIAHPIKIFDSFNFKSYIIQKKLASGDGMHLITYDDNGKALVVDNKLMCLLTWFSVLNEGIDENGRKDLVTYIMQYHVHSLAIDRDEIERILKRLDRISAINKMQHLEHLVPNKLKKRGIFYKDGRDYYMEEKLCAFETEQWEKKGKKGTKPKLPPKSNCSLLTINDRRQRALKYSYSRVKATKNALIKEGIEFLKDFDDYTKITNARLSKITDLPKDTVEHNKYRADKKEMRSLNQDRWIMTEEKTKKFLAFIEIDNNGGEKVAAIVKRLKINYKTYYEFKGKSNK